MFVILTLTQDPLPRWDVVSGSRIKSGMTVGTSCGDAGSCVPGEVTYFVVIPNVVRNLLFPFWGRVGGEFCPAGTVYSTR